jgi:hypothetical protein
MADDPDSGPPTESVDSAVGILAANEGAAQDSISDNLTAALIAIWAGFTAYWAGSAVAELGQQMAQLVLAAQRSAATITEAHLRMQMLRMGYQPPVTSFLDLPTDLRLGAETADVYQRPVRQIRYLESTGVPLDDAVRQATERLEKIALTDLQLARNVAAQQVMSALPDDTPIGPVRGYRRVIHPELGNVCGLCIAAADRVYRKRELLPLHPACVAEGTLVSAENTTALTRRWYSGRLVVFRTRSGQELRVTPNHPVLTEQGWVAAERLQVGDRVVRHGGGQRDGRRGPDEQQAPARVEDVWRAATVASGLLPRSVPLAPEDLHGDGGDAEVDVVLVDRKLPDVGDVSFVEPTRESGLVDAHGHPIGLSARSPLSLLIRGFDTSPAGLVSSLRELQPILAGRSGVASSGSLAVRPEGYFSAPESTHDGGAGYAEVGRNLLNRLAGEIEFDDLVEVEIITASCHVYNLETGEGWYGASSIVVSNCKCTVIPWIGEQDPGGKLNAEDLARIYEAAGGTTDSRALSKTRFQIKENGELGSILAPADENLKGPAQVRRQLSERAAQMRREQLQRQIEELTPRAARSQWHRDRLEQLQELLDAA